MRVRHLLLAAMVLAVVTGLLLAVPRLDTSSRAGRPVAPVGVAGADAATVAHPSPTPTATRHVATPPTLDQRDAARCAGNTHGVKLIRVSITAQRMWLCDGTALASVTPVTTGADVPDRRTHPGTWHVQGEETHRWLGGPGYSVQVDFWMPYDGDFGLHDADWQTLPFGSPGWRTQGSHGCVHVPHAAMAALYGWAPVGTTVTIEA